MDLALTQARMAAAAGEVPVGCVIVRAGTVIAQTGNRTVTDGDPTAHAEMVAIRRAAVALGNERLIDCDPVAEIPLGVTALGRKDRASPAPGMSPA